MPPPSKLPPKKPAPREEHPEPEVKPAPPHTGEIGWLPEYVYTGDKFESGLAFFADGLGRITRFSRAPKDLALARRLPGQAALPGLINVHSISWQRVLRGRTEHASGTAVRDGALARMGADEIYEAARVAFTEMLLSGITGVGEFHELQRQPDGSPWPPTSVAADQILRAAHEVGIRISLFAVAALRPSTALPRSRLESIDSFLRETENLRNSLVGRYPADEAWLGVALEGIVPDAMKAIGAYAHAQRLRVQMRLAARGDEVEACRAEFGRPPAAVVAEAGLIDKRFTALHGNHLSDEDCRILGTARAAVGICVSAEHNQGLETAPVEKLLSAGASVALGSAGNAFELLRDARALEYGLRRKLGKRPALGPDGAKLLLHAATVAGARSLGATTGALEVGRPADFFTVNLYDPSIAGAGPDTLLANVLFALERRAIREVWISARQRIVNGRHPEQGLIVGRFVEMQRRLWA